MEWQKQFGAVQTRVFFTAEVDISQVDARLGAVSGIDKADGGIGFISVVCEFGPTPLLVVDDGRMGSRRETGAVAGDKVPNEPMPGSVNSAVGAVLGSVQARDVHGDITINNNDHGKFPVVWPHRIGVVPQRAGCFQDRVAALDLGQAVAEGDTVVLSAPESASTRVLSGLGGVGKTQLAADYAERAWAAGEIDLLVWVAATTRDAIVSTYATGAGELGWDSDGDAENAARRFLAGLASSRTRWLVVLDDLQSLGDIQGLWPPHAPTGRVVATTRRRDAAWVGDRRRVIPVDVFTPAESVAYLTAKFASHAHLVPGAAELAADLDHLPLALAQAAAYMIDEDLTATNTDPASLNGAARWPNSCPNRTRYPTTTATPSPSPGLCRSTRRKPCDRPVWRRTF